MSKTLETPLMGPTTGNIIPIDWERFSRIVEGNKTFLLTSHMRADCDAVGSELAMAAALRTLNKKVRILNGDNVPPHIAFIDPEGHVESLNGDLDSAKVADVDVIMILDTSAWSQLGPMADVVRASSAKRLVIDHHVSSDNLEADLFKDTKAEATGHLIVSAVDSLGVTISPAMASALFAAIATDTGWFRFSSVNAETFSVAGRLIAAGANPTNTFSSLYEQHSYARLLLHGRILTASRTDIGSKLIYSSVTQKDLAETGAEDTDTEDIVNRLLTVGGVEVALLFLELDEEKTKVSLRSRRAVDVCCVAEQFGGGGHTAAAGIRYPGPLAEAQQAVLDAMRKAIG